tara:strand:+ start:1091 stop:1267 length:177 start_codon:yes stop_codon:yes gene_type:complete
MGASDLLTGALCSHYYQKGQSLSVLSELLLSPQAPATDARYSDCKAQNDTYRIGADII